MQLISIKPEVEPPPPTPQKMGRIISVGTPLTSSAFLRASLRQSYVIEVIGKRLSIGPPLKLVKNLLLVN